MQVVAKVTRQPVSSLLFFLRRCSSDEAYGAAFSLLLELAKNCLPNLELLCGHLIKMHHVKCVTGSKTWEV